MEGENQHAARRTNYGAIIFQFQQKDARSAFCDIFARSWQITHCIIQWKLSFQLSKANRPFANRSSGGGMVVSPK